MQAVCGISCQRPIPRPLVSVRMTQQFTIEPLCQCPPPPTAPLGSAKRQATLRFCCFCCALMHTSLRLCSPPLLLPAQRYFLHLSCQLMSCQTGRLRAIMRRYEKEGRSSSRLLQTCVVCALPLRRCPEGLMCQDCTPREQIAQKDAKK